MTILKKLSIATAGAIVFIVGTVGRAQALVLDFEGVEDFQPVGEFYNTAPQDFNISFSPNALVLVDSDSGGSGEFGNEPSSSTVLFFLNGFAATLDAPNGFDTNFSFYYSAVKNPGFINVYDGLNATGNVLATLSLPITPSGTGDPTGGFNQFVPVSISFTGTAKSIDFGGTTDQIVFDNITFGSATGATPGSTPVPFEFSPGLGILALGACGLAAKLKSKVQKRKFSGSGFSNN